MNAFDSTSVYFQPLAPIHNYRSYILNHCLSGFSQEPLAGVLNNVLAQTNDFKCNLTSLSFFLKSHSLFLCPYFLRKVSNFLQIIFCQKVESYPRWCPHLWQPQIPIKYSPVMLSCPVYLIFFFFFHVAYPLLLISQCHLS